MRAIISHFGADGLGHYVVYVLEADRIVMINDTIVKEVGPESLQMIKEHCVMFLYALYESMGQKDIKARDTFVETDYLNENDFIKSDTSSLNTCQNDTQNTNENEYRTVGRRNPPRDCRSVVATATGLPRVMEMM